MACRLLGAKPSPELMLRYCQLDPWEQTAVKFCSKFSNFSIQENAFINVIYKMPAIMSLPQWVGARHVDTMLDLCSQLAASKAAVHNKLGMDPQEQKCYILFRHPINP